MSVKKNTESFKEELREIQPKIMVVGEYVGSRSYIEVKCLDCGHVWNAMPTNLLKGRKCPECAKKSRGEKKRKKLDEFLKELRNRDIEIIGEYKNVSTPVKARCKNCGHEWEVLPSALLRGTGCPRCARTGTSYAEQIILLSLQKVLGNKDVLSRNRSAIGRELDIYIPSKAFAIEYGAWPWHKGKEKNDMEKHQLCNAKGIRLIEIFDAYNGDTVSNKDVWIYTENIGHENNRHIVKEIVIRIFNELKIPFNISDDDYELILKQARVNSRKRTKEQLQNELNEINSDILVLGEYQDALSKIEVKCKKCGHIWKVIPASLLRGLGCPECAKESRKSKMTKNKDDVIQGIHSTYPEIDIIGDYENTHVKVLFKCNKCGSIWQSTVHSVVKNGCPECKRKENVEKKERQFINTMQKRNPTIRIIGKYQNVKTPIKVMCLECGNEWETKPSNLINGHGCNKCAIKTNAIKRKKTQKQFVDELHEVNPNITVIGEYNGSSNKILVKCNICGNKWESEPSSLLAGNGCSSCSGNKRKTTEDFKKEIQLLHPSITVLSPYINAKTDVLFRCNICGNTWQSRPDNILHRKGCPFCSHERTLNSRRTTQEEFIEKLASINTDVEVLEEYKNSHSKIKTKCKKCGYIWGAVPYKLTKGIGCPICSAKENHEKMRKTHQQFVEEMNKLNSNIIVLGTYKNAKAKLEFKCKKCGYEWARTPDTILHNAICPNCRGKR